LIWREVAPWLGRVPIAKFLFEARPGVGPVGSKILAKNKDLRIPMISRPWVKVAATSAPATVWASWASGLRGPPNSLAAGAVFTRIRSEKTTNHVPAANISAASTFELESAQLAHLHATGRRTSIE
jgi:hypothetical protein